MNGKYQITKTAVLLALWRRGLRAVCVTQVEVTKYEELEEAAAELKMKRLLWDSINQWDAILSEWMQVCDASHFVLLHHQVVFMR